MKINYTINEQIGVVGNYSTKTIEVNMVTWGSGEKPKLDIRNWGIREGVHIPYKGICLTENEAHRLCDILNEIFTKTWRETKDDAARTERTDTDSE